MSDECGDKKTVATTNTTNYCPSDCYWVSQGQCFLNILPEHEVFAIICNSPIARDDVSRCVALGCCQAPSQRIQDFADTAQTVRTEEQLNEDFASNVNLPYRDNLKYIGPGVFKTPPGSED